MGTDNASAYDVDMDNGATEAEIAAVQELFDEIGFDARVTATYTTKSADELTQWVLYLGGTGVGLWFLRALGSAAKKFADSFAESAGKELGKYGAERVIERLERLRAIRSQGGKDGAFVIQDDSLTSEIVLTGLEPVEAFTELLELIESNNLPELPGEAAEVRYIDGQGWARPF